jgi:hypothetical protein
MSTHTPGPWKVVDLRHQQRGKFQIVAATHSRHVANVLLLGAADDPLTMDPRKDALLIAAAPDLLKAARSALSMLSVAVEVGGGDPGTHVGCVLLREAIAKAEGRTS